MHIQIYHLSKLYLNMWIYDSKFSKENRLNKDAMIHTAKMLDELVNYSDYYNV